MTKKLQILYVEDDTQTAQALIQEFQDLGHEVAWRKYSLAAIKLFDKEKFDVVVTDYNLMYGDTGLPIALEAIQREIPVCICSGGSWEDCGDKRVKHIWLSKSNVEDVFDFLKSVQETLQTQS